MSRRFVNPVLAREMQSRMRSWRAPAILTVWLMVTAGILWLVKTANDASSNDPFGNPLGNTDLGRGVFDWVLFVMMAILFFLIPGQAAGAIAGERERQTLVPLQVTLLSTRQLLVGKILASSAFLLLLMVAAMPVLAIAYLIGGVLVSDIVIGMLAVITTGILLATMATAVSALVRRVQAAVVLSYLLALALAIGPFIGYGIAGIIDSARGTDSTNPPNFLLVPDPFIGVADIAGDRFSGSVPSPWDGLYSLMHRDDGRSVVVGDAGNGFFVEEGGFGEDVFVEEVFPGDVPADVIVATTMPAEAGRTTVEAEPAPTPAPTTTAVLEPDDAGVGGAPDVVVPEPIPAPPPPDIIFEQPVDFQPGAADDGPAVPYWMQSLIVQAVLALGLLLLAARRLRTPAMVER